MAIVASCSVLWVFVVVGLAMTWLSSNDMYSLTQVAKVTGMPIRMLDLIWIVALLFAVDYLRSAVKRRYLVSALKLVASSNLLHLLTVPKHAEIYQLQIVLAIALVLYVVGLEILSKNRFIAPFYNA